MNRKSLLVTSALTAVVLMGQAALFSGQAFAADAVVANADEIQQTASPPKAGDDSQLEGLIVQANRKNENVQDVAVAVTAFSNEQRDLLGVVSIFDFTRATPSFEYSTALDRAFIRGVGRNTNSPGTQAGIALYIDGVYTSSTYGLDRAPILSGTYEADAGPQGTLFGRNAIGGVLQQTSAHATDEFQIKVAGRYNDHNRRDLAFSIGGPVVKDHIKLLVGANFRAQKDGYFTNLALPGQDTGGPTSERVYLGIADYKFGNVDGFVKVEYNGFNRKLSQYSQYGSSYLGLPTRYNDFTPSTSGLGINQFFNTNGVATTTNPYSNINPTALNNYNINVDFRTAAKSDNNYTLVDQTTWHLPWFDLKYIGGYTQYIYDNHQDGDGTARGAFQYDPDGAGVLAPATIQPQVINYFENRKWNSHEFDFSSNQEGPLSWIVGLYYYHDNFLNRYTQGSPLQAELGLVAGNADRNYVSLNYLAVTESKAIFSQFDYEINPKLKLTAGLRWNRDDVTTTESDHYYTFLPSLASSTATPGVYLATDPTVFTGIRATCTPANNPAITVSGATCSVDAATNTRIIGDSWSGMGGVLNLSYKPSDDTLMYAKYSRGYKAGGIVSSSMASQPILNPESLNAYEVGYKFNPSRKLTVNTAAYYYQYHNYQDFGSVLNPLAPSGFATIGFNVAESTTFGVEVTGNWHPTSNFTVTFTGNYMDAKVKDGGNVRLVDNLDPSATGLTEVRDPVTNALLQSFTYTPQPCGSVLPAAGTDPRPRQTQCITGVSLKGSSPWKVWIAPDYRFDFAKGSLDLVGTYSWRAGNVSAYSNNPVYQAPAYGEFDFRFVWQGEGKKYQIIGFVNNIQDKVGTEFVLPAINTSNQQYIQNVLTIPRTWGLEFQAKF